MSSIVRQEVALIHAYAKVTWSTSKDAEGRPALDKNGSPTAEGNRVCPGAAGATNWMSRLTIRRPKLFYVTAREQCDIFSTAPQAFEKGHAYYGSAYFPNDDTAPFWGALRAIDPLTGTLQWEWKHPSPTWSGVLSTAGGLVFHRRRGREFRGVRGSLRQSFVALSMRSIRVLVTDVVRSGRQQYVAIAAGSALFTFGLP